MPTNVVMPQMGESVAEGTIVRWLKEVGEKVDRDEPLFEISTDKVDAEIPSPAAGVLKEVRARAGETVAVDTVVAVIDEAGAPSAPSPEAGPAARAEQAATVPSPPPAAAPPAPSPTPPPRETAPPALPSLERAVPGSSGAGRPEDSAPGAAKQETPAATAAPSVERPGPPESAVEPHEGESIEDRRRRRSSPLVRRIAREHNVEIGDIEGSGIGGRVTKQDILDYIESQPEPGASGRPPAPPRLEAVSAPPAAGREPAGQAHGAPPAVRTVEGVEIVPMSVMRKRIAEHMIMSRRTSAHVHSVFEVDFTGVMAARVARKAEFERLGVKLTFMPFIVKAAVDALRAVPVVNASIDGDNIVYKKDINIGIAVALDWGLIVPVVKHADEKNILGLSRAINDLAERARSKQLKPEEVQGGTFSITNPGVFGALFGMPIISQPQVAILGVGAIEKRPVVVGDAIAIRPRAYLSLGYDHRLIDGAVADQFMSVVKRQLENFEAGSI